MLQHRRYSAAAEALYRKALATAAPPQEARLWELHARVSLARLCCDQCRRAERHDLLAPVYYRFTDGFDTADLKAAKGASRRSWRKGQESA